MSAEFKRALRVTMPTLYAYIPLGMVFGIIVVHMGFPWLLGPIMSAVIYGGSVQFLALSMMAKHGSYIAIVFACLFIALRNSFYGLSLTKRYQTHWLLKLFLIFGLVDATYALVISNPPKPGENDIKFCCYVTLIPYLYWVIPTVVGAYFASFLPVFSGLGFVLPCFFLVLAIESYLVTRAITSLLLPFVLAAIAYLIAPHAFLIIAILLSIVMIVIMHVRMERKNA